MSNQNNFLVARCPVCAIPWPTYTRVDLRLGEHKRYPSVYGPLTSALDNSRVPLISCEGSGQVLGADAYGENGDPRFAPPVRLSLTLNPVQALDLCARRGDHLLAAFAACDHRHATVAGADWCNLCGARAIGAGRWIQPAYRDIMFDALKDMP